MEEDLIASLTHQVKEEVIENYLTERRIVALQIEDIYDRAEGLQASAVKTGRRLNRLAFLVITPEMRKALINLLTVPELSFWKESMDKKFARGVRFIRVKSLTDRGKFKKLLMESYHRLFDHMEHYRKAYEDLRNEVRAVNSNIAKFQHNFDLLTIINFLKGLDTHAIERKHFLGENFTAEELASVDRKLHIRSISFEELELPQPLVLRKPDTMEGTLSDFALEIYRKHQSHVKRIMQ